LPAQSALSQSNGTSPTTAETVAEQDKENMPGEKLNAHGKRELSQVNQSIINMGDEDPSSATRTLLGRHFDLTS